MLGLIPVYFTTVRVCSFARRTASRSHFFKTMTQQPSPTNKATKRKSKGGDEDAENAVPDIEECSFSGEELPQLRNSLLSWYDANHRILPWRRNLHSKLSAKTVEKAAETGSHPAPADLPDDRFIYYVWVCEIMSQQTQVSRAAEYFRKWVAKWPDVAALSKATQEEVNEMWAGLGYYRRARYLLDGAKFIMNDHGGKFPRTAKELQSIPGVGAYTSNAIASIACGERVAVVDGNVIRVIARLRAIAGDTRPAAAVKLFADLAASALSPDRPGDFNQAMMELGATVCIPNTKPLCESCPVEPWCKARKEEKDGGPSVTEYPTKVEKAEKRQETVGVSVFRLIGANDNAKSMKNGQYLLVRRPAGGLLAGLWEFPLLPLNPSAARDEIRAHTNEYLRQLLGIDVAGGDSGCSVVERKTLGELVHVFSHIRMTMKVEKLTIQCENVQEVLKQVRTAPRETNSDLQWLTFDDLQAKGLSSGVKKVLKLYTDNKTTEKGSISKFFKPASAPKAAAATSPPTKPEGAAAAAKSPSSKPLTGFIIPKKSPA